MSRANLFLSAISCALCASVAHGAEDHSRHQPAVNQQDQSTQEPPAQNDGHAGHHMHVPHPPEHSKAADGTPTESELNHVPPPPPEHAMGAMSNEQMIELMQMEDNAPVGMVLVDQLEWQQIDNADALLWEAQAWYGDDYNKAWFKAEGEAIDGEYEGRNELLWDRIVSRWWSVQAGVRHDFSEGPSRTWAAFGAQGVAPYWFEVEAAVYVGEEGRTAVRGAAEYDIRFTQQLILQPEIEFNAYGKDDPANGIGSGLSDLEVALRLRYEIRREFAPYIGVAWTRLFGETADLARADDRNDDELQFVAGVRAWF
jgi:copper resistance protein B